MGHTHMSHTKYVHAYLIFIFSSNALTCIPLCCHFLNEGNAALWDYLWNRKSTQGTGEPTSHVFFLNHREKVNTSSIQMLKYIIIKSIYRKNYEKDMSFEQYLHLLDQTLFWDSEKPPFLEKTAAYGSRANSQKTLSGGWESLDCLSRDSALPGILKVEKFGKHSYTGRLRRKELGLR